MPGVRKISTENRDSAIQQITGILIKQRAKLDAIIDALSQPHVDDKVVAKELLSTAKRLRKGLPE